MSEVDPSSDVFSSGDPANEGEPSGGGSAADSQEHSDAGTGGLSDQVVKQLEPYVGEGKKFKTVEDFVKGYSNAQQFIEQLQEENAGLRGELKANETLESLLSSVRASGDKDAGNRTDHPNETGKDGEAITEEQISKLVQNEVTRLESERSAAQNERYAAEKLAEMAGSGQDANRLVKEAAREFGVSVSYLRDQARISPSAFLKMVTGSTEGGDSRPKDTSDAGSHNAEALARNSRRYSGEHQPWSYWKKMRKEMRSSEYFSPETQNRIMRSRQALGESFYDE